MKETIKRNVLYLQAGDQCKIGANFRTVKEIIIPNNEILTDLIFKKSKCYIFIVFIDFPRVRVLSTSSVNLLVDDSVDYLGF